MNLSIRGLAEKALTIPGAPSYSTIDNFIRKGTGHLDTAWAITKLMGLTLNDNFIDDEADAQGLISAEASLPEPEAAIQTIAERIMNKETIETEHDFAELFFIIGKSISPFGYEDAAAKIISAGKKLLINSERGRDKDE